MTDKKMKDIYDSFRENLNAKFKETKLLIDNGEIHLDNLAEVFVEAERVLYKTLMDMCLGNKKKEQNND